MLTRVIALTVLLLSAATAQPVLAAPAGAPSVTNARLFTGANVPWFNWACDFGCGTKSGVSSPAVRAGLTDGFGRLTAAGVHTVRWWTFEGDAWQINRDAAGRPSGLNPAVYADFDAALELADKYDLVYDFVLFSSPTAPPRTWIVDSNQRQQLADALAPLFERYKNNPHILSWEIYNEPEWDLWNNKIPQAETQATVKLLANTVHSHSGAGVTIGSATIAGLAIWMGQGLDFYSPHWYSTTMSSGAACARCTDAATLRAKLHLDGLPIVFGEFDGAPSDDTLQRFNDFRAKGYAGAWAWSLLSDRTSDKITIDLGAVAGFNASLGGEPPAQASPNAGPSAPNVVLLANWVTPVYATPGQDLSFNQDLQSDRDTPVVVDFEVYSQGGPIVARSTINDRVLAAGDVVAISSNLTLPSALPAGTYLVKVNVFSAGRTTLYGSSDSVGSFVVDAPVVSPADMGSTPVPDAAIPDTSDGQ